VLVLLITVGFVVWGESCGCLCFNIVSEPFVISVVIYLTLFGHLVLLLDYCFCVNRCYFIFDGYDGILLGIMLLIKYCCCFG